MEEYKIVNSGFEKLSFIDHNVTDEDDIENIESQICAKIQQITALPNPQLSDFISLEQSINRVNGRQLSDEKIYSKGGLDVLLFSILQNEESCNILPIYSIISKITEYKDTAFSAFQNGVLDFVIPNIHNKENPQSLIEYSYRIIINCLPFALEMNPQFIATLDLQDLPIILLPCQTLEFLLFCAKYSKETFSSLSIIKGASSVKMISDNTALLLLWITSYIAMNNIGDIDVFSALIEGIDESESIYSRSLIKVNRSNPDLLQPFLQSTLFLLECNPLIDKIIPLLPIDFIFDILESGSESILIAITVIMKLIKMEVIKDDVLNDLDKVSKVCKLVNASDYKIKAKCVRLLEKMVLHETKETCFFIFKNICDELIDVASNECHEGFYILICINNIISKMGSCSEKDEVIEFLLDNDYEDIIYSISESCSDERKKALIEQIRINYVQEIPSDYSSD